MQSVEPPPHCDPHLPIEQNMPIGHAVPHVPQFIGSTFRSVHESPQRIVVPAHVLEHLPIEHTSPSAHLVPHAPQFSRSRSRTTHASPH
jgi:hypothetical protein